MARRDLTVAFLGTVVLFIVIVIFIQQAGSDIGFGPTATADLIAFLPGIVLFAIGMILIGWMRAGLFSFPAITIMGIGLAFLFNGMYTRGMITTIMLEGLTIDQLMMWTVVIAALVGAVVAGLTARR